MTSKIKCVPCKDGPASVFQDKRYGLNMRVYTSDAKGNAHCTVCGAIHHDKGEKPPKKKTGTGGGRSYTAIPPAEGWPGGIPEKNGWMP
jgi:hypothetical protein